MMREVALLRVQPASIRLVDNEQFTFGQALKPEPEHPITAALTHTLQRAYVTRVKGFDPTRMCAATLLLEGASKHIVDSQLAVLADIAKKYGGMMAGEANGARGYFLTYMIAYLRDYAMNYWLLAESFETSVPWTNVLPLCHGVKDRIRAACRARKVEGQPFVSCRVTQTYDTGACVYFYFAFSFRGLTDPERTFSEVEAEAREEILSHGGSLSHHHGIGKHRKHWMPRVVSQHAIDMLVAMKTKVDPKNIMGLDNLFMHVDKPHGHPAPPSKL
jgi:alkyldihydroxyacetonephosphate synthase